MAQSYLLVALATGLVLGLLLGGRPRHLAGKRFRWWLLLPLAVALQFVVELDGVPAPVTLLLVSYAYLLLFCAANLRHPGMGVVLVGIALNAVVITANGGMPVRVEAVRAARLVAPGETVHIVEVKHRIEEPGDRLTVLGDIIPIAPLREIVSFGDLVIAVGVADLLVHLLRPARARRRRPETAEGARAEVNAPAVIDLVALEQRRTPAPAG